MHHSTFEYLNPTDKQKAKMKFLREEFATFAGMLDEELPEGPDKTYLMRKLREVAMWANVTITRAADGTPRGDVPAPDENIPGKKIDLVEKRNHPEQP